MQISSRWISQLKCYRFETNTRVAERSKIEAYTNHNKESLALKTTLLTH
nr:MAG TPA: hypothetical protein [Caudoviricetes sp.]